MGPPAHILPRKACGRVSTFLNITAETCREILILPPTQQEPVQLPVWSPISPHRYLVGRDKDREVTW